MSNEGNGRIAVVLETIYVAKGCVERAKQSGLGDRMALRHMLTMMSLSLARG